MIIKLLMLILIIFIMLFLVIFLEPIHVSLNFKNNNLDYNGFLNINYYIFHLKLDFNEKKLKFNIQIKSLDKTIKTINLDKDKKEDKIYREENLFNKIEEILPLLVDSIEDILELVILFTKTVEFEDTHLTIDLGLKNNNLTIKFCNFIWAITAPLYPIGFKLILTPIINDMRLKSNISLSINVILLNIVKLIFKIVKTENLKLIVRTLLDD